MAQILLWQTDMWKHPHPLKDFDYIGKHHYSLTWNCESREPVFNQRDRVELVRAQILRACVQCEFEIIVDCYMLDHVHQLVRGRTATADGRKFFRLAKQYSGYYFQQEFKMRLWQRYGHDNVIRPGDLMRRAQYIIENPVKAGLVATPEDYPYTGSQIYTFENLIKWAYS